MLFLIKIAFGGLSVTIEQRVEAPGPRVIDTTGVAVEPTSSGPGLAKCAAVPARLRLVESA